MALVDVTSIPNSLYSFQPKKIFGISQPHFHEVGFYSNGPKLQGAETSTREFILALIQERHLQGTTPPDVVTGRDLSAYLEHEGFGPQPVVVAKTLGPRSAFKFQSPHAAKK